jgi:hypothetical protein
MGINFLFITFMGERTRKQVVKGGVMIHACCICSQVTKVNLKTLGDVTHGFCRKCYPEYLRGEGFDEDEINELMKSLRGGEDD